ncbi:MAG TPA: GNAT family N-acetyltransferase [Polyangiaceae bacterium]|jgi:GNAT superfamily N-acetyltransferase|nr:GNAT family N-acetyltransferase [Polyangiaceae bacterium]
MKLQIRPAGISDASSLATLNHFGQAPHASARPDIFKETSHAELEAHYRALLAQPTSFAFIAELASEPLGYARGVVRETAENPCCFARRWLELDEIAVATQARKHGVARALIERVIELADAEGLASVELGTWSFNQTAQAVFAKLGFSPQRMRFERRLR